MKSIEVVAAIIIEKDRILVTRRGYGDFINQWEFPGGKMEPGEFPPTPSFLIDGSEFMIDVFDFIAVIQKGINDGRIKMLSFSFDHDIHCYL